LAALNLHTNDQLYVLSVVSKSGVTLTANLKSPILLNATRHIAIQAVVTDEQPLALPLGLTRTPAVRRAA
jgi:flagellar assembly factor FliW